MHESKNAWSYWCHKSQLTITLINFFTVFAFLHFFLFSRIHRKIVFIVQKFLVRFCSVFVVFDEMITTTSDWMWQNNIRHRKNSIIIFYVFSLPCCEHPHTKTTKFLYLINYHSIELTFFSTVSLFNFNHLTWFLNQLILISLFFILLVYYRKIFSIPEPGINLILNMKLSTLFVMHVHGKLY